MDRIRLFILLLLWAAGAVAHAQVTDSVDVLDYDISVDLRKGKPFAGDATLTVRLAAPCSSLSLSLYGTVDSVWIDGNAVAGAGIDSIPLAPATAGDTVKVRIAYTGKGFVENYGWGGFHFDSDMSYNLGVAFGTNPHNVGAALMPCRDNFHDKATYTLRVRARSGWSSECSGVLQERKLTEDSTELSVWRIAQPVPTYLVSVSQAPWHRIEREVVSLYDTYPLTLGYTVQDSARVVKAFAELDSVVPMFERCLGPYRWGRIGYIATKQGSMEHVNNIALDSRFMASESERAQMTIAHELGHAWFGNLITCTTEADMWINEGGASFCSELAMEANKGKLAANTYYQTNLEKVLREAHITDNGYRPLSPMPHSHTYGTTTYDKGALVWHSLRGLLSDELFFPAMQRLMDDKAFGNVSATEVRDSISSYCGYDMTDFFDFHVFEPGFVDYHLELVKPSESEISMPSAKSYPSLRIRVQGVGTENTPHTGWVPFCLYDVDGSTVYTVLPISGTDTVVTIPMGLDAAYCVLDPTCALSDAATLATFDLGGSGTRTSKEVHVRVACSGTQPEGTPLIVEHHWGTPWDTDTMKGIDRVASRYWMVRGSEKQYQGVNIYFRYVCESYTSSDYAHLDRGFYNQPESIDSMVVLYRADSRSPWRAVSHQRTGNEKEGFFKVENVCSGEYTLAIVDMSQLDIDLPSTEGCMLSPNPLKGGSPMRVSLPSDSPFTVNICDMTGKKVWQKRGCRNGQWLHPLLKAGTYFVQIENKSVSLQTKLIVL